MANPRKFSEKIALHNQKQAEETAEFEKIMKEVSDATNKPGCVDGSKGPGYREKTRSSLGPMRRPTAEKRPDTSPYSAYLTPPLETGWRRTHSDSSLHTSSQDQALGQRRGTVDKDAHFNSDPLRRNISSPNHEGGRSSSDLSRVTHLSMNLSQTDQGHKKNGSLPDLTSFHLLPPLGPPLDQDDRGQPYSCGSYSGSFSPMGHHERKIKFEPPEAPGPPQPSHYQNQGLQQQQVCQQFVYQPPLSPLQPPSPQPLQNQQSNTLNSYRTPVSRPSPQASPSLPFRFVASPRSSSPQSPSSPASIGGGMSPFQDHNSYFMSQQTTALQHHFENFTMDDCVPQLTPEASFYSTSPHYSNQVTAVTSHTAPNTPSSIPDIVLTDFSNHEELGGVAMVSLDTELFPSDDCLRAGLGPIDLEDLNMLSNPDNITDSTTEDHLRLDRL